MNTSFDKKIINLDTFSSEIELTRVKIFSVEWVNAEAVDDKCVIYDGDGGPKLINWKCHTVNHPHIKYFDGQIVDFYIDVGGVESGELIIILR